MEPSMAEGKMNTGTRVEQIAGLAFLILLLAGCFVVLRPFLSAILWALVISFSPWPGYAWVERRLGGRKGLAAMVTTLSIAALVVVPLVLIGSSLTDEIAAAIVWIRTVLQEGLPDPPDWVARLPLVGGQAQRYWAGLPHKPAQFWGLRG